MNEVYLSRLLLDPQSRQVQRETADPYQRHRTIMKAFPDNLPKDERRKEASILHRLDVDSRTGAVMLLVQSHLEPDWQPLVEKGLLQPADPYSGLDNPAVKVVDLSLSAGQTLHFRLVANPTVKKKRDGRKHSNRVPLVREERQLEWLANRAESGGFRLLRAIISNQNQYKGWKGKERPPLTVYMVQYDGRLQITDADKFRQTLRDGIGPAKAFGCGLLSIAPG